MLFSLRYNTVLHLCKVSGNGEKELKTYLYNFL